jgi:hypothetical protein
MNGDQAGALLRLMADLFLLMETAAARDAEAAEPEPEAPKRRRRAPAPRPVLGEP